MLIMEKISIHDIEINFREVGGKMLAVDSVGQPLTLADILSQLEIVIDDYTQFCRIIRVYGNYKQTIEYRAYTPNKVRLNIHYDRYDRR